MSQPHSRIPSRKAALETLQGFLERVPQYGSRRNFVTSSLKEVSLLSPYIRLRLISEEEVLATVISRHSLKAAEKFLQEVCWRSYWRNWLELNSAIWRGYDQSLVAYASKTDPRVTEVCAAASKIATLNCWVEELTRTGYLHNHIRMYFASIWIHTLKLPWELGAEFFMQHLYDGDPASNTLSWRWVAGLHTVGKTYLAKAENIEFHTGQPFESGGVTLATNSVVLQDHVPESKEPQITCGEIQYVDAPYLIVASDEELSLETVIPSYALKKSKVVFVKTEINVAPSVKAFRAGALNDAVSRLTQAGANVVVYSEAAARDEVLQMTPDAERVVYLPSIGNARDAVERVASQLRGAEKSIRYTRHPWDLAAQFPRATGFFPYWNHMQKVLQRRYAGSLA